MKKRAFQRREQRAIWRLHFFSSRTSPSPSAARRCSPARNSPSRRASGCRSSDATARASRRCCGSRPASSSPTRGSIFVQPGALVRYLPQEPDFAGFATTRAYVEAGLAPTDDPHVAQIVLEQLGLTGSEDPAHLSGGEARRASLARVLAPSPDILLLDEPTNHLDLPTIEWLERELDGRRAALVIISHDRRFLSNLTAHHGMARSRRHAQAGAWLCAFRGMARRAAGRGRARAAQAGAQDRSGRSTGCATASPARRKRNMRRGRRTAGAARGQRARIAASPARRTSRSSAAEPSGKLVIEAKGIVEEL